MPGKNKSSATIDQSARFIEAARHLGADEDEAAFKAKLAQIAQQKPKGEAPEPPTSPLPKAGSHD